MRSEINTFKKDICAKFVKVCNSPVCLLFQGFQAESVQFKDFNVKVLIESDFYEAMLVEYFDAYL